jgi:hypothetical protein
MKVYGWNAMYRGGQKRVIIAARSWSEAAKLGDVSPGYAQLYGAITGNAREIEAATQTPGVLLGRPADDHNASYEPVRP